MKVGVRVGRGLAVMASAVALTAGCENQPGEDPRGGDPSPTSASSSVAPPASSGPVAPTPTTSFKPAPQQFDHAAMQDSVHQVLTEYHQVEDLGTVVCPPRKPVKKGTSFVCTATIGGEEKKVPIKVTSDDGDYKVGAPR
ncbi:MAG: DUF4333 domain-containing protein [Thermocrispum sp.]